MTERPITYHPQMIQARLAGKKSQTRRVINKLLHWGDIADLRQIGDNWAFSAGHMCRENFIPTASLLASCHYGCVGDRLRTQLEGGGSIVDEITGLRVERLQDISHEDLMLHEGIMPADVTPTDDPWKDFRDAYLEPFIRFWNILYPEGPKSWPANPWLWVISTKPVEMEVT